MNDSFWLNDMSILVNEKKLYDFLPVEKMSIEEKLNSLVRLSLYLSVILSVLYNNINYILILIGCLFLTYLIYIFNEKKDKNT